MAASHDSPTIPQTPEPGRKLTPLPHLEKPGDTIGPYRLLEMLGEGGFGVVYLAERREPIVQRVALKIVKPGMDTRAVIARFEQERQALAVMDHPNVARVFDAGATATGRPYFVMEHVQGEPITAYCDRNRLDTRARLALFVPVCEAVQHAHMKGLIHRDLKPGNVLVASKDGAPVPKVIDFGVAKAISQTLTQKTIFTELGQLIGTPEYMSPEQAEMGATDVDTRTDVYSLGVLLYELLTGTLPFDPLSLRAAGFAEIQRIIREVDPPRPSTRLSRLGDSAADVAHKRQAGIEALQKELHRELEWIPLRAMRKDRTQRYRTAAELADDVRNYLEGRPLIAGPESASYRARKFVRRRRGLVVGVGAVVLALVAGVVGTGVGLVRAQRAVLAERAAHQAETVQRKRAEVTTGFLKDMLSSIDPEKSHGRDITVREIVDDAAARLGTSLGQEPEVEASIRHTLGETYNQLARLKEAREQFEREAEIRARVSGPESRETLAAKFGIGGAMVQMNEVDGAIKILGETGAAQARVLGDQDADTLQTHSLLGFAMQLSGDNEGALKVYRETLPGQVAALGKGHKATLETMCSIADVLQNLGRLDEAATAARELIEAGTASQGADGPQTLVGRSILASILNDLGRYAEAEALGREVLAAKRRMYGPDHSATITSASVLANSLEHLDRFDEAVEVLKAAIASAEKTLGAEHASTLTYKGNLARIEQLRGNLDEAERNFREVLEIRRRVSGPQAQGTLIVMNNLGLLLLAREKPAEAEPILTEMVAGVDKNLPAGHWMRGQARVNLARSISGQGKYDEAEPLMLSGYEVLVAALPVGHDRLKIAADAIAQMYTKWGKPERAAEWAAKGGGGDKATEKK